MSDLGATVPGADYKEAVDELLAEAWPAVRIMEGVCSPVPKVMDDNQNRLYVEKIGHSMPLVRFWVRTLAANDVALARSLLNILVNTSFMGIDTEPKASFFKDVLRVIRAHWTDRTVVRYGFSYMLNCLLVSKDMNMSVIRELVGPSATKADNRTIIARAIDLHRFPAGTGQDMLAEYLEMLRKNLGFSAVC